MNKKTLLLVSIASIAATVGVVIAAKSEIVNLDAFAIKRNTVSSDYTLTLDENNRLSNDNSVLTSLGNEVSFATEGTIIKNPGTGWVTFGNTEGETSRSIYNITPISGMKSISFTFTDNDIYLHFGYKEDGVILYSNYVHLNYVDQGDIEYQYSYSFDEVAPSYFKLESSRDNKILDNVVIKYSCQESGVVPTEMSAFSFTLLSGDTYRVDGLKANRKSVQTLIVPNVGDDGENGVKPLTHIKSLAFCTNDDIEYVYISEGITDIGDMAFYLDAKLHYIVLPTTLVNTGNQVFDGCMNLNKITITESQVDINLATYAGNQFFEEIEVLEGNPNYYVENGMLFANSYGDYSNALLLCPAGKTSAAIVPNNCQYIHSLAFKNAKVPSITIGSGVQLIDETFRSCNLLESFTSKNIITTSLMKTQIICSVIMLVHYMPTQEGRMLLMVF